MADHPGYEIAGCRITCQVYESVYSQVYRAQDSDGKPIVLKVLKEAFLTPIRVAEYRREYSIAQRLKLSGVANVYELKMNRHQPTLVIEDFGGDSLDLLGLTGSGLAGSELTRQMSLPVFLPLAISLSHTLSQVHSAQVVHKDINPSNIVFNPKTAQVKLIDFGLANVLPQETASFVHPRLLEGTLPYLSPEQTGRMNRPIDYRSDFYALGVTFYQLLTGQLPFQADDALAWVHHHIAHQPMHPSKVNADVPEAIAQIILKLMAKTAEDRYQSAAGLQSDLEHCWAHWQREQHIPLFQLAQQDQSDRFQISQKLYGRESEIVTLQQIFSQVSSPLTTDEVAPAHEQLWQLVLIKGYSGVGKSALVRELYRPMTVQQGHFIAGKYDQARSPIPYQAFSQAFNQLCQYLLTESAEQLAYWRNLILQAIKANGQLLIDIIPDLALIIGPQPPVVETGAAEAQSRFQRVFHSFVRAIAQPNHPLILFIDDLQWADSASLQLLNTLFEPPADDNEAGQRLMLIGAYRDNEVETHHPLFCAVTELAEKGATPTVIELNNLPLNSVNDWIAETLDCSPQKCYPLAKLVHQKTRGNAFFTAEFLKTLHVERLLSLSSKTEEQQAKNEPHWQWDIEQIKAKNITDNVVVLMTQKLVDLPETARKALQVAACLGSQFTLDELARVVKCDRFDKLTNLMPAIQQGFLLSLDNRYKLLLEGDNPPNVKFRFQHDRVQQAAYELMPSLEKERIHFEIGQSLWQQERQQEQQISKPEILPPETSDEHLFEIVNHLNLGAAFVTSEPTLRQLVALNLQAGRKAIAENAYEVGQAYFKSGLQLLGQTSDPAADPAADPASDSACYQLTQQLTLGAAQSACLLGQWEQMSQWIEQTIRQSHSVLDAVPAYELQIEAAHAKNQLSKGIELTLSTLQQLGYSFPAQIDSAAIGEALTLTATEISRYSQAEILALPEMRSPQALAVMRLINAVITPCFSASPALLPLVVTAQIRLILTTGNTPSAVYAYAVYGLILSGIVGDLNNSDRMGKLSRQLLQRYRASGQAESLRARTQHVLYAFVDHWHEPLTASCPRLLENYQLGLDTGDLEYAVLSAHVYCLNSFLIGQELQGLAQEMSTYSEVMRQLKRATTLNFQTVWHQTVLNLLGESPDPTKLQGAVYDEIEKLPVHHERQDATALLIVYWHKAMLCYWFGQGESALRNIKQSANYLQGVPGLPIVPVWHFYDALIHLDQFEAVSADEQAETIIRVAQIQQKLQTWSDLAPHNHEHRIALIQAEEARILGKVSAAMDYYDSAIDLAQTLGYNHERALANERAARFYRGRGSQRIAQLYLKEAKSAYTRWGAIAKLRDLEQRYPKFLPPPVQRQPSAGSSWTTTETDSEQLDIMSVLKASQGLADDIQLDKLLTQLMTLVLENAGAEKGYLVIFQANHWYIEATATIHSGVSVNRCEANTQVPIGLLNYVLRTQKSIVLKNATTDETFGHDPYLQQNRPLSVLCLSLVNQGKLNGIIYLENNLMTNAFTQERLTVLQLLSSQAAISLENAQLYSQLQQYSQTLEEKVAERTSELEQVNKVLQQQAIIDGLTQLTNRRGFDQALERAWPQLMRSRQPLSLLLCDVDHFKAYNDHYGHLEGDQCLQQIAKTLQSSAQRQTDTIARYGGEEFALILPDTTLPAAMLLAEKVRSRVEQLQIPHVASPTHRWVTISIGVTSLIPHAEASPVTLIAAADQALYVAKSAGRNTYSAVNKTT